MTAVADLPGPWAGHPYLVGEHPTADLPWLLVDDEALLAYAVGAGQPNRVIGLGEPAALARLLRAAARDTPPGWHDAEYVSIARGAERPSPWVRDALGLGGEGSAWDFLWTDREPAPVPGIDRAERLDPVAERHQVAAALARCNPSAETSPDHPDLRAWWAVRDTAGRIVSLAGLVARPGGVPAHLVSVGTDPALRGRGLGAVVVAAAIREGLGVPAVRPMVSLGVYADNPGARRLYERLGMRVGGEFRSWRPGAARSAVREVQPPVQPA